MRSNYSTPSQKDIDRFWSKVDRPPSRVGCWMWAAGLHDIARGRKGEYGMFCIRSKNVRAHRFSLMLHLGRAIGDGMMVLHSCDEPRCVNPSHLREGTARENYDDMRSRSRVNTGRLPGELHGRAKLTWSAVSEIRRRHANGETQQSLADEHGVTGSTVWSVVHNQTWVKS